MKPETPGKEGSRCVLLHYHEIGLKGKNRPLLISRLARRAELAVETLGAGPVRKLPGRLILELSGGASWPQVREALSRVFGLANFSLALRLPLDLEAAAEAALAQLAPLSVSTFRVRTRKAFDTVPISSREWDAAIGARVQARRRLPVSLTYPGTTVHIEALPAEALLYVEKVPGPGGLPVGMSGRVAALLSGGIDSPVAAWRMLKRGCEVVFVHFHGAPPGRPPRRLAAGQPALPRPLREFAEGDRPLHAPGLAGGALPALHGADRRAHRPAGGRQGPGDRGEPGPGGEPDLDQPRRH